VSILMMQGMLTRIIPLDQRPEMDTKPTRIGWRWARYIAFCRCSFDHGCRFCGCLEVIDKTFCLVDVDTRKDVDIAAVEIDRG
jgi:hypothetical protein